jgi:hypothetical protein
MQKGGGSRRLGKQHRAKEAADWAEVDTISEMRVVLVV